MVNWSSVFQLFEQVQKVGSMHSVILGVVNNAGNVKFLCIRFHVKSIETIVESRSKTCLPSSTQIVFDEANLKKFCSNRHQTYTHHKVGHNIQYYCKMKPLVSSPPE